jgi:hypothetical protein
MPESFDSMLAELADTTAAGIAPPDLAAVRRRARQRTVRRRTTVSALAMVLLCGAGTGYAVVHHQTSRTAAVHALDGPSSSPVSIGASPTPSATSATAAQLDRALAGVWQASPVQNGYLVVYPDGGVGLSLAGNFSLCSAELGTPSAAASSQKANLPAKDSAAAGLFAEDSAAAGSASGVPGPNIFAPTSVPLTQVSCDGFDTTADLTLATSTGSDSLSLNGSAKPGVDVPEFLTSYTRLVDLSGSSVLDPATAAYKVSLARLAGSWQSINPKLGIGSLSIDGNGDVRYSLASPYGASQISLGAVDAAYTQGVRVLLPCASKVNSLCGSVLVVPGPTSKQITVYTSSGPEVFIRKG